MNVGILVIEFKCVVTRIISSSISKKLNDKSLSINFSVADIGGWGHVPPPLKKLQIFAKLCSAIK